MVFVIVSTHQSSFIFAYKKLKMKKILILLLAPFSTIAMASECSEWENRLRATVLHESQVTSLPARAVLYKITMTPGLSRVYAGRRLIITRGKVLGEMWGTPNFIEIQPGVDGYTAAFVGDPNEVNRWGLTINDSRPSDLSADLREFSFIRVETKVMDTNNTAFVETGHTDTFVTAFCVQDE